MKAERLSHRLASVAAFVEEGAVVADIGSDHAYLPCFLVKSGKVSKAIAGEVVQGPYESAVRNVKREGLEHAISVRYANGLQAIQEDDKVDTVTIAGMGGTLIATILEEGKENMHGIKRVIAQPNLHAMAIRDWAVANGWFITDEEILKEDGKIYEVLVLEKGHSDYSEAERLLGPILIRKASEVFMEKWKKESEQWESVLQSLQQAEETDEVIVKKEQLRRQLQIVEKVFTS